MNKNVQTAYNYIIDHIQGCPNANCSACLKINEAKRIIEAALSNNTFCALAANELRETYGGHWRQHPEFPLTQWQTAVAERDTRLGYWEWIANVQAAPRHEVEPLT